MLHCFLLRPIQRRNLRDSRTMEEKREGRGEERGQSSCIWKTALYHGVEDCGRYAAPLSSDKGYDSALYGSMLNPFLSK